MSCYIKLYKRKTKTWWQIYLHKAQDVMMPLLLTDQLRSTAQLCSLNCRKRLFVFICCSGRWVEHWEQKPHARAHSLTHWHGHTQGQLCLGQGLSSAPVATEDRAGGLWWLWSECCRVPAAGKATHLVTTELVRRHRAVKGPVGGKGVEARATWCA